MPRVKQILMRLELDASHPYSETTVHIYYDNTDRSNTNYRRLIPKDSERFYVKLPQVMADALGREKSFGSNQDEALEAFKKDLELFKNLKAEHHKVIIYDISTNPNTESKYIYQGYKGYKVDVWAAVFDETVCIDGLGGKRYSYEQLDSPLTFPDGGSSSGFSRPAQGKRKDCQVPWTKANEAFFVWVCENMKALVERLDEIRQPEKMIETITAGRLLPLGQSEVKV